MTSKPWIRRTAMAVAALALPLVLAGQAEASTTAFPNDTWNISDDVVVEGVSVGGVIWNNRSATLQGYVEDLDTELNYSTRVYFTAYAGGTKVDGDGRTATPGQKIPFTFDIGDPDLIGGFDRLSIQVCRLEVTGPHFCSPGINLHRDDVVEKKVWRPVA
jgi:hypothetical protein